MGVMNQGLGGNRILHDIRGDSGLRRFDRDVLVQPGVTHAIVMLGTNDLRNRWAKPEEEVTAEEMISGLKQLAVRAQTRGIKFWRPFRRSRTRPFSTALGPRTRIERPAVKAWIRDSGASMRLSTRQALRDRHPTRSCRLRLRRPPPPDVSAQHDGDRTRSISLSSTSGVPRPVAAGGPGAGRAPGLQACSRRRGTDQESDARRGSAGRRACAPRQRRATMP